MRLLLLLFSSSSFIVATLGQNTTEVTKTSSSTTVTRATSSTNRTSTRGSSTTTLLRNCGNPGETDVCHYTDNMKEVCDVCFGVSCQHGTRCAKKEGQCESDCICIRSGEVLDKDGICRAACGPNPCQHNGTCRIKRSKQICECIAGYDGALCENVKNLCLEAQPSLCPVGAYECLMNGVNNYTCHCAAGYFPGKNNSCVKVGHTVKLEMHFTETPYSEIFNDPSKPDYKEVRDIIRHPFEYLYGDRLVALEFHNFTQGSLVANLVLSLKPAENGSRSMDQETFEKHKVDCNSAERTGSEECFGKLGRVFLPQYAWQFEDERCNNVFCPMTTTCEVVEGQTDETRCVCAAGYEGYGSVLDSHETIVELCRDIDECNTILGACKEDETCINLPGSYECTTPCTGVKCPGYAHCVATAEGKHRCDCSWIYAGSSCSFPWTLIFLSLNGILFLSTATTAFLLWRTTSADRKGRYNVFSVSRVFSAPSYSPR